MYRRELIIGLLGAGLGLSFYAIANLLDNPTNIKTWIGLISGIAFFVILFFVIKYVEKEEKKGNDKRDTELVQAINKSIQMAFTETNELLKILIDEIRKDRDERNNNTKAPDNNTTK